MKSESESDNSLARLDERLARSPIREGWIQRTHFADACAALWLEGLAVHVEDLVLHDAERDVRHPTHDLVRAHAALRARRRIVAAEPDWAFSDAGLAGLRGRDCEPGTGEDAAAVAKTGRAGGLDDSDDDETLDGFDLANDPGEDDPLFADAFAAVDAAMARANRTVADDPAQQARRERDPLVHDPDWDEDARLGEWRALADETSALPATLEAAILLDF